MIAEEIEIDTAEVVIPTLHFDQRRAWNMAQQYRYFAVRCGRRWGKTTFGECVGGDDICNGRMVGWFAPDVKRTSEVYEHFKRMMYPVLARSNKNLGEIRADNGGGIDFWTLDDEDAGRGRMYHRVIVDEGAFTDDDTMTDTYEKSIAPTLLDFQGSAMVLSNTNGKNPKNFFWQICNQAEKGFVEYHAPSYANPYVPRRRPGEPYLDWLMRREHEFAELKRKYPPLVFQQEYLAEFVDWSGVAFFALANLLQNSQAIFAPTHCEAVFATIDTATKTKKENDGTAVIYWALVMTATGPGLVILDWDIQQIEGAFLETWLPTVFQQLEHYSRSCVARSGSLGAYIEDKASGMVLLQQAANRGWPATAIDSKLTGLGKSERAISCSGYVYRGEVKISQHAYNKVVVYKGVSMNHLIGQVTDFRVGVKEDAEDDLLDCFTYGATIGLGNNEGF